MLARGHAAGASGADDDLLLPFAAGWWAVAGLIGLWLGRRAKTSSQIAALLAGARTQMMLPELNPGRTVSTGCGPCSW